LSHLTWKVRDDKYDLNHIKSDPWNENEGDRRVIRHVPWYQTGTSVGLLDYAQSV